MFKHKLVSLILVVALLFCASLPAWAGSFAPANSVDNGSLLPDQIYRLGGPCEDGTADGCNYG
jgi:hypothetical protein